MQENAAVEPRRSRAESKEATRKALLYAGLLELIEHGLDTPSLDRICARAGFTRGAFYVHFKDRDDFMVEVTDWVLSGVLDRMVGVAVGGDLETALGRFTAFVVQRDLPLVGSVPVATHRVLESIARSDKLKQRFAELMRGAASRLAGLVANGRVRRDLEPGQTASLLIAIGIGALSLADTGVSMGEAELKEGILRLLEP
ncbi:MAG: TetR/AcrR family transcriptional regulator [Deltaproteobacteria bacterium]|nr:TetR/AcrR family transcriptional regulator [Deltaproteobacteria bacterium]